MSKEINPDFTHGIYYKKGTQKYIDFKVQINLEQLRNYVELDKVKEHLQQNNNKLDITVKTSKAGNLYGKLDDLSYKKELTSSQHSPDRDDEDDGLPF